MTAGHRGATADLSTLPQGLGSLPPTWTVLHDVVWPGRRPATVDHVVVGPPGVFVVRGCRARAAQHARSARSAVSAAAAVAAAVPFVPRHQVHAVVCVDGTTPARADRCPAEQEAVHEALVVGSADLVTTLLTRPAILPADHALALGVALRAELEPGAVRPGRPLPAVAPAPRRTSSARGAGGAGGAGGAARSGGVRGVKVAGVGLATAVLAAVLVAPQLALSPVQWATDGVSALGPDRVVAGDAPVVPVPDATSSTTPAAGPTTSPDREVGREEQVVVPVGEATAAPEGTEAPEVDEVDGVAVGATTAPESGADAPETAPSAPSSTPGSGLSGAGPRGRGGVPGGGRAGAGGVVPGAGAAPRAADFVALLASLLGPGGRAPSGPGLSGVLGGLTDLVRGGSLPGGLSLGGTPAGPGRCVHDAAADVSLVLAVNGRDGHLALREGPCAEGRELARVVERGPADYRLQGDRSLARPVAALLRPGGRSS